MALAVKVSIRGITVGDSVVGMQLDVLVYFRLGTTAQIPKSCGRNVYYTKIIVAVSTSAAPVIA